MSTHLIQSATLANIANAIRAKGGSNGTMTPAQMATKIEGLEATLLTDVLWQNSDSGSLFYGQSVDLSNSTDNYAFIGVNYLASTSIPEEYYPVFSALAYPNYLGYVRNATSFVRPFDVSSGGTVITFGECLRGANAANSYIIPESIMGYNFSITGGGN